MYEVKRYNMYFSGSETLRASSFIVYSTVYVDFVPLTILTFDRQCSPLEIRMMLLVFRPTINANKLTSH